MKDNNIRKEKYDRLKKVGYNSKEATKYKDLKESKIVMLIESRRIFNGDAKAIHGGK